MPRTLRAVFLTVIAVLAAATPAAAGHALATVVISEFRTRGPAGGNDEFVELRNRSAAPDRHLRLRCCRAARSGTPGDPSNRATVPAGVTLAPGQSYLFANDAAAGYSGTVAAATDVRLRITDFAASNFAGIRVVNGADGHRRRRLAAEPLPRGRPASPRPAPTATTPSSASAGSRTRTTTPPTSWDRKPGNPQNRAGTTPADPAPAVADSDPGNGDANVARDTNIRVEFSEPVTAADAAFSLHLRHDDRPAHGDRGERHRLHARPAAGSPHRRELHAARRGRRVPRRDTDDPPDTGTDYSATFTHQLGVEGLRIHDIQGRQHLSPYRDRFVAGVPGIVTARRFNGLYIQDPRPDRDERTSEGIFIFTSPPPAAATIGTAVTVSGRVTEFRQGCTPTCTPPDFENGEFGASAFANLTITEIDRATVTVAGTGTIAPTVLGRGGRALPRTVIDDDTPDPEADDPPLITGNVEDKSSAPGDTVNQDPTFDPREDGIDFYESLEGMLTRVNRAVVVEPANNFNVGFANENTEVAVLADNGEDATIRSSRGPIVARAFDRTVPQEYRRGDFNPERLILNDPVLRDAVSGDNDSLPEDAEVGDRFTTPVDAVVDYAFGNYKLYNRDAEAIAQTKLKPETAPSAKHDELSVASYNVENLDPVNDAERIELIATQIRKNLRAPDILGIQEVQDNDGEGPAGPNGDLSWQALVDALAEQGVTYEYRQIDPVHNADGGAPGANIRVGFLFRPKSVDFVDRPGGTATTATEDDPAQRGAQLTFSPGPGRAAGPGVGEQPQAAGGRVPLPREEAVHGRQPPRLQGRGRAAVRALPGALPAERAAAPRPGRRAQRLDRAPAGRRARRAGDHRRGLQRLPVLGDQPRDRARRARERRRDGQPVAVGPGARAVQLHLPGHRPGARPHLRLAEPAARDGALRRRPHQQRVRRGAAVRPRPAARAVLVQSVRPRITVRPMIRDTSTAT